MKKQIQNFKQYFFFLGFFFFAITLTAQGDNKDFKVSDITGTYIGYQQTVLGKKDMTIQWKVVLNNKMDFSLWAKDGDLWLEQVQTKSTREKFYTKKGNVYYEFNALDKKDIKSFSISILSEQYKKLSNTDGLFIFVGVEGGNLMFDMNREGGNPKVANANDNSNSKKSTPAKKNDFAEIDKRLSNINNILGKGNTNGPQIEKIYKELRRMKNENFRYRQKQMKKIIPLLTNEKNNFIALSKEFVGLKNELYKCNCRNAATVFQNAERKTNKAVKTIDGVIKKIDHAVKIGYASGFLYPEKHLKDYLNEYVNESLLLFDIIKNNNTALKKCEEKLKNPNRQYSNESSSSSGSSSSSSSGYREIKPNFVSGVKVGLDCKRSYGKKFLAKEITPGWAAAKAGIRKGDEILEINGVVVKGMIEIDMDLLFLGKAGTSVKVKVQKKNDPTPHTYHMIRGEGGSFTEEKTIIAEDEIPSFSGKYEGDDLLKLLGRDIEDKAVKKWLSMNNFERSKNCSYENYCGYSSKDKGISISFKKRKLVMIRLYYSEDRYKGKFFKKTPLNIPLGKPHSGMNSFGKDWETYGEYFWKKTQNNITFRVFGEKEKGIVEYITMDANDGIDWKAYHQNLTYSKVSNEIPSFTGEYAGDNLLNLMGRYLYDPAIIKWFEKADIEVSKMFTCDDDFCVYQSKKYGITLTFDLEKLTKITFFKGKQNILTPLNVPVGKSLATFNPKSKGFTQGTGLSTNFWRKEEVKFIYTISTNRDTNTIKFFTIFGEK